MGRAGASAWHQTRDGTLTRGIPALTRRSVWCYNERVVAYGAILALASIVLTILYAIDAEGSIYGRGVAAAGVIVSFVLPASPVGQVCSVLLQFAVSVFVLLRMKLLAADR